ncbi:putative reverse transcriptase from transposon X-element protein, partial [Rhizoctonia solani 123E]
MSADPPSSPTNHERFRQWITDVEVNPENNDPNCKFSARMFIDHDLVCDLPVINSTGALRWSGLLYRNVSPDSTVLLRLCMNTRGRPRYFNYPNFAISEVDEETGEMTLELRDAAWIVTIRQSLTLITGMLKAEQLFPDELEKFNGIEGAYSSRDSNASVKYLFKNALSFANLAVQTLPESTAKVSFLIYMKAWGAQLGNTLQAILRGLTGIGDIVDIAGQASSAMLAAAMNRSQESIQGILTLLEDVSVYIFNQLATNDLAPVRPEDEGINDSFDVEAYLDRLKELQTAFHASWSPMAATPVDHDDMLEDGHSDTPQEGPNPYDMLRLLRPLDPNGYNPRQACMDGTREVILTRIVTWTQNRESAEGLMWISGQAGMGKTSVATSLCQRLDGMRVLAGSFFCQRDSLDTSDPLRLINNLVHEIAMKCPAYAQEVAQAIRANRRLCNSHLDVRYNWLIKKPLERLQSLPMRVNLVIVIDALDECGDCESREQILDHLHEMAQLVPWLKVIITARPVGDIQDYFAQKCPREPIIQLQDYDATANIRAYIEGQVAQLAENEHWPSDSIDQLCTMSGGPNFKKTNWPLFRQALEGKLAELPGLRRINSQEEIDKRVEDLMKEIYEAVRASTPDLKLCAWSKRWWSPELGAHRTLSRTLSARSYRARHDREDPVHEEYRLQRNRYSQAIKDAKRKHWEAFLEELDEDSMWTAARYLSMEPTDGGRTRVPSLKHALPNGTCISVSGNDAKSRVLMEAFFPPAPPAPVGQTPTSTHPPPVEDLPELQTSDIRRVVYAMKPHKASGPDGLPACVYIHSIDLIDKHLLPIFRASLRLGIYPAAWRESRTVVLRKPGKPDYGLAKAYRPIALLNVISKVLSSCVANRLNSLAEEHGWLPDHHFGGRPGHTTTDALHLITKSIKDAWATKKVASALFLDVKGAFPHAYPPRLAENMKNLGVPAHYVNWMLAKLSGRSTCLSFDDYTSDPLPIDNGIDQGCPLSVIFYLFYNSPLVKVPRSNNELCIAYIDDITFVTWGHTFEDNHRTLTEMMSREGGALDWSDSHNSTFELDKTACIDFAPPATSKNLDRPPLTIRDEVITPVKSHTLLGVTLDQTLNWRKQCDKALAKGMSWAGQLNRLARMSYGTPMKTARRLYLSIAVPRFSYAADIWYSLVTQGPGGRRSGSAGFADRLARIQSTAARAILGAMRSTPVTSLDAHLDLLPMYILMNEACQRAAVRLAATPTDHPLRKAVIKCAIGRKRHQPPLQRILHFAGVKPSDLEQWPFNRNPLPSTPPEPFQDRQGAAATAWADKAHLLVFADAAVSRAGVAAAAILWGDGDRELRTGVRLGEPGSFSSLDAEVASILLAAHLVTTIQQDTIVDDVTIYSDSQAAISCINHHAKGASRNLIRETRKAIRTARKGSGGTLINLVWSPGHMGIPGNEAADAEASRVASGHTHPPHLIPHFLVDFHPATNPTTLIQSMKTEN